MKETTQEKPRLDLQAIFEVIPDLYMILSPQFHIVDMSLAYAKATMVQREEVLGRYLFDVFPDNPDDTTASGTKNLRESLERVLQTKAADTMAVQKYDVRRPQSEGGQFEERYWSPINIPLLGKNEQVLYIIHRVEDVTEFLKLKQSEHDKTKLAEELQTHAGEMEVEIYRRAQEIQETNKQLLAANKELESFSYTVSHDLRNPLQVINGFASLLLDTPRLNNEEKDYLQEILKGAESMRQLIDDLLDFARSTGSEILLQKVDLSETAKGILLGLQKQNPQRQVEVQIEEHVIADCDANLIKIVLVNLLYNAWKYTSKTAAAKIEFGKLAGSPPVYFIRDNGVGFPPEKLEKLFMPFSRLHSAKDFSGSGIGLATVKRIIERHNGKIWAESEIGKGATFYCSF